MSYLRLPSKAHLELVLHEEELLSAVVAGLETESTIMADKTTEEARGRIPIQIVDHVTAVACTQRTDAAGIGTRMLCQNMTAACHDVLKRRATPIARYASRECVAEASASMEIDSQYQESSGRIGLQMPTVVPSI